MSRHENNSSTTIPLRYIDHDFSLTIEEINHLRDDDLVDLIHRKKLHLVLDLDHTLLHSPRRLSKKKKEVMKAMHGFHVIFDDQLVKLRPGHVRLVNLHDGIAWICKRIYNNGGITYVRGPLLKVYLGDRQARLLKRATKTVGYCVIT
ncbi:hypothetical protein BVRB_4g085700 [Beta vulgaris subsp. vulgaris]|nr:hypothetical protein BVRB_4g085700 [Beta vulgaris subsp. vulgaris]